MIGAAGIFSGEALMPDERPLWGETFPSVYLNAILPSGSKTLFIGEARPLYYRADIAYQTTWDRGPLSRLVRLHPTEPHRWLRSLKNEGFTHLLVNTEMLELWEREGRNDPLITAERVLGAAERFAEREREFSPTLRLYRLRRSQDSGVRIQGSPDS